MKESSLGISELEYFLLSPRDDAMSIFSFAENALDERGYSRFAMNETS